jgi:hypothetical protein
MINKTKYILAVMLLAVMATTSMLVAAPAFAATTDTASQVQDGVNAVGGEDVGEDALPTLIQNVINVILFIVGSAAVIMIIVGGIRYVTSNGDQANVKAAKDTILYSVIGLVVAVMAYAIVQFVVSSL